MYYYAFGKSGKLLWVKGNFFTDCSDLRFISVSFLIPISFLTGRSTQTQMKVMAPSSTPYLVKAQGLSLSLMRSRGTFTPLRGWTVRRKLSTRYEHRLETAKVMLHLNPSLSLLSRSRISMIVSLNSWRGHTSEVWLSCLLLVREMSLNLLANFKAKSGFILNYSTKNYF